MLEPQEFAEVGRTGKRRSRRTLLGVAVAFLLNLYGLYLFFLVLSAGHPGGFQGALAETVIRAFGLHDSIFASLSPTCRDMMWKMGATGPKMTLHRVSYYEAVKAVVWGGQSRYTGFWQQAESWWLEREVAYFVGAHHAAFVSTGTSALVVALQALGIGLGDEVIVPTYTWVATAASVTTLGAIPIMADIDETLGLDPRSILAVISPRTKGIIAVHMRGVPCNIEEIARIAAEKGLHLVEDAAQAFGATVHGKMVGTFGAAGITSVNPSKTFHSGGQGGLVWIMNASLRDRMDQSIENGLAAWGGLRKLPSYQRSFGEQEAAGDEPTPFTGHCFRSPSEWHAAFLRSELRLLPAETRWLQGLKRAFRERLRPELHKFLQTVADPSGDRSYTVTLILRCRAEAKLLQGMLTDNGGVPSDISNWMVHYLPHVETLMKKVSFHSSGFPWLSEEDQRPLELSSFDRSTRIMNRTITIQISSYYSKQMMEFAADVTNEALWMVLQSGVCSDE